MALFSFYNVRKPRQFEHKPIYWDPDKEELEKRISDAQENRENIAATVADLEEMAEKAALTPEQREELNALRAKKDAVTPIKNAFFNKKTIYLDGS